MYSSMVGMETMTPFTTFRGATQSMTKVVTLWMLGWILEPMAMMVVRGRP